MAKALLKAILLNVAARGVDLSIAKLSLGWDIVPERSIGEGGRCSVKEILLNGIQMCDGERMADGGEQGAATYDGKKAGSLVRKGDKGTYGEVLIDSYVQ